MNKITSNKILMVVFSLFIIISALSELALNETVVHSMAIIRMPAYLLYFLGISKILGLVALWFSPYQWLKEWAYAGFVLDFTGAIFCFGMVGQLVFPDVIMAPLGLLLCVNLYIFWKRAKPTRVML